MTIPIDPEMLVVARNVRPAVAHGGDASSLPINAETLFGQMAEAIACYKPSGDIVYVNPAAEHAFSLPAHQLIGRNLWQLVPDAVGKPFQLGFERVAQSGGCATVDQYFSALGRWFAITLYRVGRLVCTIARDITVERQAQIRLEMMADASRAFAAAGLDLQTTFDTVARRLATLLGDTCIVRTLSPDGRSWEHLLGSHDRDPQICRQLKDTPLLDADDGINSAVIRTRKPLLLEKVDLMQAVREHSAPAYRQLIERLRPHSVMVAPMLAGKQLLGTIAMCRRSDGGNPRPYSRDDLLLLQDLAHRAALAILNARTHTRTAELEERLRLALAAAEIGTWDFDPASRRLSWDARCRALFGLKTDIPVDYDVFLRGLHPDDITRVDAEVQRVLAGDNGGEIALEYRTIGIDDGVERWLAGDGRVAFDAGGRPLRFTGTVLDISDHKAAEAQRERQLRELERNLRFSDMFVGILGHDLRNPLSAIIAAANLLRRRADSERISAPAGRILSSADRMGRMIDQLLDFTRIRLGGGLPLSRENLDLAELCQQVVGELAAGGRHNPLQLSSEGDPCGAWDRDRLWQLVANITSNAVNHGAVGTPVQIHIDGRRAEEVLLEVANEGEVPQARLASIFEPLKHDAAHRHTGSSGLGLGLFISHQIALAHQGSIVMSSGQAQGTRLIVRLPRRAGVEHDQPLLGANSG